MKLKDLVSIESGLNSRKIKEKSVELYSISDFRTDLKSNFEERINRSLRKNNSVLRKGDIIMSLQDFKVALVSSKNDGKFFSQRYVKLIPKNLSKIKILYLLFAINESVDIKRQINSLLEGSVLKLLKMNNVENIDIQLPSMEYQKRIGKYYKLLKEKEYLTEKKMSILNGLSIEYLNNLNKKGEMNYGMVKK